jgi:uncharacterized membrane-anchored protein
MKKELVVGLFAGLIAVQIGLPVSMIAKRESTLRDGAIFRFKTAPVDPYDAFRGRYVAIRAEINKVKKPEGMNLKYGQKVYAQLTVDEKGFAQVSQIAMQKPKDSAYLTASVTYPTGNDIGLNLPIDRYYMEEKAAPRAEQAYREHSRRDKQDAYVVVRVKDGFAVIEGLYVGDQRIEDAVRGKK